MQILIPTKETKLHPYLKEISLFSKHEFISKSLEEFNEEVKIINIHWPEAIFGWLEPRDEDLEKLETQLIKYKKTAKLVYTKHDYFRNKGTTRNFTRLFKLIEEYSDAFIHLGEYSRSVYERLYPKAIHTIIPHPLFKNTFNPIPKAEARNLLGINKEAFVVLVPGQVRTHKERNLVLRAFKDLKIENRQKALVATNMRTELQYDFPGRVRLKSIFDVQRYFKKRFERTHQPPTYYFNYSHLNEKDYGLRFSACDLVLIPRVDSLNSGNIFLGLTFDKIVVGPSIGNMEEVLKQNDLPSFEPDSSRSINSALEDGVKLHGSRGYMFSNRDEYSSEVIAGRYDDFLKSLI